MEENIDITLYGDVEEKEETIRARVDTGLAISIISKTLTEKLQVKLKPSGQGPVTDSRGVTFSAVGETSLNWHRKDVPKTNEQTFFVVDLPGSFVIFGANALSLSKGFPIQTLGLKPQTDEEKKRQEIKKQAELAKRAKEKKDQEEREKQKQGQGTSSK